MHVELFDRMIDDVVFGVILITLVGAESKSNVSTIRQRAVSKSTGALCIEGVRAFAGRVFRVETDDLPLGRFTRIGRRWIKL